LTERGIQVIESFHESERQPAKTKDIDASRSLLIEPFTRCGVAQYFI